MLSIDYYLFYIIYKLNENKLKYNYQFEKRKIFGNASKIPIKK